MARFDLSPETLASAQELALTWTGHGEPTAGYRTTLYLWDFVAGTWVPVADQTALGTTTHRSGTTADRSRARSRSACAATTGRCHPGVVRSIARSRPSPRRGPRAGPDAHGDAHADHVRAGGGSSPATRADSAALDCSVCHDAHGSEQHLPLQHGDERDDPGDRHRRQHGEGALLLVPHRHGRPMAPGVRRLPQRGRVRATARARTSRSTPRTRTATACPATSMDGRGSTRSASAVTVSPS